MNKDYFVGVPEFAENAKDTEPEAPQNPQFPTNFDVWLKRIGDELTKIQDGSTKLRSPLHFGTKGIPSVKVLERFIKNPSASELDLFLMLAKQDLGSRVTKEFYSWLLEANPEVKPFVKEV